ncbi:Conserved_hypothetical protein [Hexamita inflata]|uniref:RING-type domain-containing protein n=1 Tax=Hexamita inflata TaxID=28002 RepID=A0AA86PLN9_9EUKA|nr:Conserved hypothetical protein [Hexamita inflata]
MNDVFQHVEQYFHRFHKTFGIHVINNQIHDLHRVIAMYNDITLDIYFLNFPNSILVKEAKVLLFDNQLMQNDKSAQCQINRGDHIKIVRKDNILSIYYMLDEVPQKLLETPLNAAITLELTGHLILIQNEQYGGLETYLQKLTHRTYQNNCLDVWSLPINLDVIQKLTSGIQIFTVLQTLIMSPFAVNTTGLKAAFQKLSRDGLIQYHTSQLQLGYEFLTHLSPSQFQSLIEYVQSKLNNQLVQTGVAAQLFRILLRIQAEQGNIDLNFLVQLMNTQVIKEAISRFDGKKPHDEFEYLVNQYMHCYQLAYTNEQFDVLKNLRVCFNPVHTIDVFHYVISALFLEPDAVDFLMSYIQLPIQANPLDANYFGLYYIMQNAINQQVTLLREFVRVKASAELICNTDRWIQLFFYMITNEFREKNDQKFARFVLKHMRVPVICQFAIMNLDNFEPEKQKVILFNAFQNQKGLSDIKKYHSRLTGMSIFKDHDAFQLQVLNYKDEKAGIVDIGEKYDYADKFRTQQLNIIKNIQTCYEIEHSDTEESEPEVVQQNAEEDDENNTNSNEVCPICYGDIQDNIQLSCTHVICANCASQITQQCPICRAQIIGFSYQGETFQGMEYGEEEEEYS